MKIKASTLCIISVFVNLSVILTASDDLNGAIVATLAMVGFYLCLASFFICLAIENKGKE